MLPIVAYATREVLDEDLTTVLPGIEEYLLKLGQRPSVAKTWADWQTALDAWFANQQKA